MYRISTPAIPERNFPWGFAGTLIGSQVVDDFSAGRLFSALTTDSGRVYTFGGGVNGELGRSSAFQTSAREVDARVLQVGALPCPSRV